MKKFTAILLSLLFIFSFAACNSAENEKEVTTSDTTKKIDSQTLTTEKAKKDKEDNEDVAVSSPVDINTVIDKDEGKDYQSIVVDGKSEKHEGDKVLKEGTFTTISDEYNGVTRCYVWGYNDNKMNSCWQWEIKSTDLSKLPKNGSLVAVSGVLENSEDALDRVWIAQPSIDVKEEYKGEAFDVDMSVMSPTLARVQVASLFTAKDKYEGKTVAVYCRVISENLVGHPTDSSSWQMHIKAKGKTPEEGTLVVATGVIKEGTLDKVKFSTN